MLDNKSTTSEFMHNLFLSHQLELIPEIELSSNDLLIDLARIGLGIACIPDYCLKHESKDLFILKTLEPLPRRQLAVSVNPNLPILTSTEEFLNLLRHYKCFSSQKATSFSSKLDSWHTLRCSHSLGNSR